MKTEIIKEPIHVTEYDQEGNVISSTREFAPIRKESLI